MVPAKVLRSMMPPEDGAAKAQGPPPFATLEKSELACRLSMMSAKTFEKHNFCY